MKLKLFLLLFLFFSYSVVAQQSRLSEDAEISILTVGPGTSLYDSFGHNAFRVKDKIFGTDLIYGYGEYDFEAHNFYLKFAQGQLNYKISRNSYKGFYNYYSHYDRQIREQILNLTSSEKQELYTFLQNNFKPENSRYLYDFFYDNCATKMRDIVEIISPNKVIFNAPQNFEPKTFRALIHEHVKRNSWGSFGIDIALGSVIDKEATAYEHMYLPKYIYTFFDTATLNSGEQLVKETKLLYQKKNDSPSGSFLTSPLMVLGLISIIILLVTYFDFKKNQLSKWLDIILFAFTGLTGILLLLLWFATDHTATANNYNLLWAFPFNIIIITQLFKTKVKGWFIKYIKFLIILLCLLSLHWMIGIQVYAIGLVPFLLALCVRYLYLIKYLNQSSN